jgi:hypothetical protein
MFAKQAAFLTSRVICMWLADTEQTTCLRAV